MSEQADWTKAKKQLIKQLNALEAILNKQIESVSFERTGKYIPIQPYNSEIGFPYAIEGIKPIIYAEEQIKVTKKMLPACKAIVTASLKMERLNREVISSVHPAKRFKNGKIKLIEGWADGGSNGDYQMF